MPEVIANNIKAGDIIDYIGDLWRVLKTNHIKPGKGGAYVQIEMKGLLNNLKRNDRFISSKTITKAVIDESVCVYLYTTGSSMSCMNAEDYEQFELNISLLLGDERYLIDNMDLELLSYNDDVVAVKLPKHVSVKVIETEAVIKGQTATSSYKSAILENGIKISVPPFIKNDDMIIVNTEDDTYYGRAKS